jgi:hypothetical protein
LLSCEIEVSADFPSCSTIEIPTDCKQNLNTDSIDAAIKNCNFTFNEPETVTSLNYGGVLVQGYGVSLMSGQTNIPKAPPLVLYSPETITIIDRDETYLYPPAVEIDTLIVAESKLTPQQIVALLNRVYWKSFWAGFSAGDYIRYTLILIQLILFPIATVSLVYTLLQRRTLNKMRAKKKAEKNFEKNKEYLVKQIR